MTRRRGRAERIFDRKFPAPPPTPEGKVYAKLEYSGLVPVAAEDLSAAARRSMGGFDDLPPDVRAQLRDAKDNIESWEYREIADKVKSNQQTAKLGFGKAF